MFNDQKGWNDVKSGGALFTASDLSNMSYDELLLISIDDMPKAPVRGNGFPHIVVYECSSCGESLEGSERHPSRGNNAPRKDVKCPYCGYVLWVDGSRFTRRTAYKMGHFENERKRRWLKDLRNRAKRK